MSARPLTLTGLATLGLLAGWSLTSGQVAWAAPPETPVTENATMITGTTATLHGELNPAPETPDGYEFTYSTNGTCAEGSTTEPGAEVKGRGIKVYTEIAGLLPNSTYTFCLVAVHTPEGEPTELTSGLPLKFTTLAVTPAVRSESASSITRTGAVLEAQVNPNNQATTCDFEYGTSATLSGAATTPCDPATLEGFGEQRASANVAGLSPNTGYYYRVAAENGTGKAEGAPIQEFRTSPPLPTAITGEASSVTNTSATITATVNPGSIGPNSETQYFFAYGASEISDTLFPGCSESAEPPCFKTPVQRAGSAEGGESTVAETADLPPAGSEHPPLHPNTVYHYRIVAYNNHNVFAGGVAFGADQTFTTLALPPVAAADPPVSITSTSSTLLGSVNSQGVTASYHFEYGTTLDYGSSLAAGQVLTPASGQVVSANIPGLTPDTTYHYRLVASNNGGTTDSSDETFTTYTAGEAEPGSLPPGFSLTGPAPARRDAASFPDLTGYVPAPAPAPTASMMPKAMTNGQKLHKGLTVCKRGKARIKRSACERKARNRYRAWP
jgi:hypothetical protein